MNRLVKINFLLVLIPVVLLLGIVVFATVKSNMATKELESVNYEVDENGVEDVEGYARIINNFNYMTGKAAIGIYRIVFCWIPGIFALAIGLPAVLALLLLKLPKGAMIGYRIGMVLSYIFQVLLLAVLILVLFARPELLYFCSALIGAIVMMVVLVLGIKNFVKIRRQRYV